MQQSPPSDPGVHFRFSFSPCRCPSKLGFRVLCRGRRRRSRDREKVVEMQQPAQMMNIAPSYHPSNITTEQIQKLLDENKKLILAILEYQNLGKLSECAQYQAHLQKNLMYLAAIADAQPPAPTMPPQMPQHSAVQQGNAMQHTQAAIAQQQTGIFPQKLPFQFNEQQQQQHQLPQFQQQQAFQGHMGMRPGSNNGMHLGMQTGLGASSSLRDARGSKQDGSEAASGDGQGKSSSGHGSGDRKF